MTPPTAAASWPAERDTLTARQDRAALLAEFTEGVAHPVHRQERAFLQRIQPQRDSAAR